MGSFLWGVLASLVAWLIGLAIIHWVIPLGQGLTWKLTDISGRWLAYIEDPATHEPAGEAEITQRGPHITMTLHRQKDRQGKPTSHRYKYRGTFKARQLTLLWEALDRPDFRVGAMVLHLAESAKEFSGLTVFYDDKHTQGPGVGALSYWLRRP